MGYCSRFARWRLLLPGHVVVLSPGVPADSSSVVFVISSLLVVRRSSSFWGRRALTFRVCGTLLDDDRAVAVDDTDFGRHRCRGQERYRALASSQLPCCGLRSMVW